MSFKSWLDLITTIFIVGGGGIPALLLKERFQPPGSG